MISLAIVPLAPMTAALIALLARRRRGSATWISAAGSAVSIVVLLLLSGRQANLESTWFTVGTLSLQVGLALDGLSWTIALLAGCVSLLITVYSAAYMREEPDQPRFFAWMSVFTGAMLALVLSSTFVLLFAAWEAIGVASWALIAFRHTESGSLQAASKAFLMTRLGDLAFLLAWLGILIVLGTVRIDEFLGRVDAGDAGPSLTTIWAALFLIAAVGKSAQLPLSAWLPDAMIAPSPVSALIHSATLVIAGVYLILRLYPLFELAPAALTAVLWIGGVTALLAALAATAQADLKRLLAWSTISQTGEMMMALGLGGPIAATLHLITHATYKSGLFLGAGLVEHATGTRRLDEMGNLRARMPFTAGLFAVCALSLAGFPLLSGYWSEEHILAHALRAGSGWAVTSILLILLSAIYISRAASATFAGRPGSSLPEAKEGGWLALAPLAVLTLGAALAGFALKSPLEGILPFTASTASTPVPWTTLAILASLAGLALGAWGVRVRGAAPALGSFPLVLAQGFDSVVAVGRAMWLFSKALRASERALDTASRSAAAATWLLSKALRAPERAFDMVAQGAAAASFGAAAVTVASEQTCDSLARWTGAKTVNAAAWAGAAEDRGFAAGGNQFAESLGWMGKRLRALQSGKVYLYTLNLFAWILVIAAIFAFAQS